MTSSHPLSSTHPTLARLEIAVLSPALGLLIVAILILEFAND